MSQTRTGRTLDNLRGNGSKYRADSQRTKRSIPTDRGFEGSHALYSPNKLKTRHFKIELSTDDDIRDAAPGSTLLVNAFDYVNEGKDELLSMTEEQPTLY